MGISRERWQQDRLAIGGQNPLTNFELSTFGFVDLSRAHPGGLAQLVSAHETRIGNLVRDGVAQARALSAARRIRHRNERIRADFGFETVFIAAGLVETNTGRLPILLWPAALKRRGEDYDLSIATHPQLNPALAKLLRERSGGFDELELLALAKGQNDLIPLPVLSRVTELLQTPDIGVEKLLVLGNFAPNVVRLSQQSLGENSSLVAALLAGRVAAELGEDSVAAEVFQTPVATIDSTLVANADATQLRVLSRAMTGASFAVETLPGCGYLQTVVNLLAQFALADKRVHVIAPRQQTLDELAERLTATGLAGLGIRTNRVWFDAVAAISRFEKAPAVSADPAKERVTKSQAQLAEYFEALNRNSSLEVSVLDAMRKLAELAAIAEPPTNTAKLRADLLEPLQKSGMPLLEVAHAAGLFEYGPQDSAWFGARFSNSDEIAIAVRTAKALHEELLRTQIYQINRYLADRNLSSCTTVEDWSKQLNLLLGIRETLERFKPEIFDRPLTEMVAATAPRRERGELSGAQRRRFTKLAKEFIRPGATVANLHQALTQAEEQRQLWQTLSQTQAPPTVPLGLADVQQKFETLAADLELLQRHLNPDPDIQLLTRLSFEELEQRVASLATSTEILDRILERASIFAELADSGLVELANQLSELHPSLERVRTEFELCWWQSALEAAVAEAPKILEYSAERLAQLESEFESSSNELIELGVKLVSHRQSTQWKTAITSHPAQADALRAMLRERTLDCGRAHQSAQPVWQRLATAVMVSPFNLDELSQTEAFDALFVLDATSVGMAETVAAFERVNQVIAFGDAMVAAPQNFETIARPAQQSHELERESCYELMVEGFGFESISRNYRVDGQVLARYLNDEFYQGRITFEPSARGYFGEHGYELVEITEGNCATSTIEGATESMDAELVKTVELVLNHARWTPQQSLLVATASVSHAERIQSAVSEELPKHPQLAEFFDAHGREKFDVVTLANLTHRIADRVILSIGFGRTVEGKVSSSLGDLSDTQSARRLANLIVSARSRLTVVSCFTADAVIGNSTNDQMLRALLDPSHLAEIKNGEPDAMLADLSLRLQKLGARTQLNFGGRIGLAVSHGKQLAVVDPDWGLVGDSWDEKLRLRPGLLRAMGWRYLRVHVLEMFSNPQQVANRIAAELGIPVERRPEPLFETAFEDTATAWGDPDDSNDSRLRDDKPPHWG